MVHSQPPLMFLDGTRYCIPECEKSEEENNQIVSAVIRSNSNVHCVQPNYQIIKFATIEIEVLIFVRSVIRIKFDTMATKVEHVKGNLHNALNFEIR